MRWSFRNRPIILLTEYTLEIILEIQHSIRNHSKCFWVIDWVTILLLTINESWDDFLILRKKRTSWGCLLGSWLKLIFHWKVQLFILFKSSFKFFADKSLSNTRERDVSTKLNFQISHLNILKKVAVGELNLEEPLLQDWSVLNFDHLELHFAFYPLESLPKYLVSYLQLHFVLTYK